MGGQPIPRQRVNKLISNSRNFFKFFKSTPLGLIFCLSLLCRPTSFLEAFLSNLELFPSVSAGPAEMVLARGLFLFSCLACSSAPRSGSSSCFLSFLCRAHPGTAQRGLGSHCYTPLPEWLLNCKHILGKHKVDVKRRKLVLCKVQNHTQPPNVGVAFQEKWGEIPLVFESPK